MSNKTTIPVPVYWKGFTPATSAQLARTSATTAGEARAKETRFYAWHADELTKKLKYLLDNPMELIPWFELRKGWQLLFSRPTPPNASRSTIDGHIDHETWVEYQKVLRYLQR